MKKVLASILLLVSMLTLLASCTGTTPDAAASEAKASLSPDSLNWSITVEGGSAAAYTQADAQKHDIVKGIASMWLTVTGGNTGSKKAANHTSFICEGIKMSDFLADMGKSDAASITYTGTDVYGEPFEASMTAEEMANEKVMIAWIYNKKDVFPDSTTHVAILDGSGTLDESLNCLSIEKIVIG